MNLPKHIVIVEDEVITQRYLQDIFSQHDVVVTGCFDNGTDTIAALKSIDCDMILMDINIKGSMDGIQLARNLLRNHTIPIVFITAHNDDETLEELLELAPYGFIGKPFSSKEIIVALRVAYKQYLTHKEAAKAASKVALKEEPNEIIINAYYRYSQVSSKLYYGGNIVKLSKKQSKLLEVLTQNINHAVDYDTLTSAIWEEDMVSDSALRTLVYSLRKLLPELPIVSQSKLGYSLEIKFDS